MKVLPLITLIVAGTLIYTAFSKFTTNIVGTEKETLAILNENSKQQKSATSVITNQGLSTNTKKTSIDLNLVLHGGVRKDGIPSINNPKFTTPEQTDIPNDAEGIFLSLQETKRFYPFAILAYHEIVNDQTRNESFAVTFCPLCDTGIVFDRNVEGKTLQFGVSGLLYESNLLMYDTETESLWSQTLGKAVLGDYTGTALKLIPAQIITLGEAREKYGAIEILSTDTGYTRNYKTTPYKGYEATEKIYFPTTTTDNRYFAKEPFYVFPFKKQSVAFPFREFRQGTKEFNIKDEIVFITRDGDEIRIMHNNTLLPGYIEFWFSWVTNHQEDGMVLNLTEPTTATKEKKTPEPTAILKP